MRRRKRWLIVALALGSGLLSGYLTLAYVRRPPPPLQASEPARVEVAVAARDLPEGTLLRREDVAVVPWPGDAVPAGYAGSAGEVVGRGLISEVRRNEPLLRSKLADKEAGGGLPIVIPEGLRAVSVEVDEVVGVAGFVLPGTRVDVLATLMPSTNRSRITSRIILQNIRTLTAGQTYHRDEDGEPRTVTVVTLLVTPAQAEALTLAANEGRLHLALRNTLDTGEVTTRGVRVASLVSGGGSPGGARRSAPPPRRTVIETYQGGQRTLIRF